MGHLKAHCPDLAKPYPFDVNNGDNVCLSSDCVSLNNQCITSGSNKVIELYKGLPQGVTSEVTMAVGECVNTNSTDIDSSGKGTVSGVDADAPVVNQHKISDNNAITAMLPEVKSGCKSGANHADSLVPLSEHWPSPSIEIPSMEGLDDDEYPSR